MVTFIRSKAFVSPEKGLEQRNYTKEEKEQFRRDPVILHGLRHKLETAMNSRWTLFWANTGLQNSAREQTRKQMREIIGDNAIADKLIPNLPLGCRRLTPGVGYLETLMAKNVTAVFGSIQEITSDSVKTNDSEYQLDVLICATGFDTSFLPRFSMQGRNGVSLSDIWREDPKGYLGLAVPGFPNYFNFLGPSCPIGNGPVLVAVESQAQYICKFINKWQREQIRSFEVRSEAVEEFVAHKDKLMKGTVWVADCRSWYKSNKAGMKVTALWPGSTLHYVQTLMEPRFEDWMFSWRGNRWDYLGDGFSTWEKSKHDLAFYIRNEDKPYSIPPEV